MTKHPILLIEDNRDDAEAVLRGFSADNNTYPVLHFNSSTSALAHLNDSSLLYPASLIILDLNMPGLDGRRMLEIIKSHPKYKSIPVIIFTTSSDQKDVRHCYENGANSYIQKPVNFEQMKSICHTLKEYWFNSAILPEEEIYL